MVCAGHPCQYHEQLRDLLFACFTGSFFRGALIASEIECSVDEPGVTEGLREIPELAPCERIIFLSQKTNVIAQGQDAIEPASARRQTCRQWGANRV